MWCWWTEAPNGEPRGYLSRQVGAEAQEDDGDSAADTMRRLAVELGVQKKAAAVIDLKVKELGYGGQVLKSDRTDLGAEEAWRIHHLLTRAENAFRCMKSPLAERPIFHQVQRRVETHIFLCVLAYHLLVAIEKTLLDQGVHTSWASVRKALATHHIVTIVLPTDSGATMRIRKASTADSEHRELYRLLGVDEKIVSPKTIWSETGDHE